MMRLSRLRPGLPSLALLAILVITAAWWGLAFFPADATTPEWLLRMRMVCFGTTASGLPDTAGWIVLIGEPIGMVGFLLAAWGKPLKDDLRRLWRDRAWRAGLVTVLLAAGIGLVATGRRVAVASGAFQDVAASQSGVAAAVDIDISAFELVDQHGTRGSPASFAGGPAILTFAFGHCTTVCPAVVHDVLNARSTSGTHVPLVVITLDPWRDTPEHLPMIVSAWGLGPQDRVVSGSVESVERVLDALGVERRRDERTGNIEHANVIMITDGRGHVVHRLDGWWGRVNELLALLPAP